MLAWPNGALPQALKQLQECSFGGIEVVPSRAFPEWPFVDDQDIGRFRVLCADSGLAFSGMQSILFGKPELQLLDQTTWPALRDHCVRVIELASALGCSVLVMGSPKNRLRGSRPLGEANALAAEFFTSIVDVLEQFQCTLAIEPNAPSYGADFMTDYGGVLDVVKMVSSQCVRPMVDMGCLGLVGQDPASAIEVESPVHVHLSALDLTKCPSVDSLRSVSDALGKSSYDGWAVLEMIAGSTDWKQGLRSASENCYEAFQQ
jgi:D-psicose/D-tagatose/L-ribulose 3-epimerase